MTYSAILRVSLPLLVAFAAIALASTGRAQYAPPAQARASLDGWYGEVTWSFHQKEDTSTPPDHSRSGVKFDGKATIRVYDNGRGGLLGVLDGSQKVDTHWWSYTPPGSKIFSQVCRGSAPPIRVWARVEGSPPAGSNPLSLQLADVEAKITPTWSGGGPNAWCNATLFAQLTIDNGATISGLVRSLQPVGDGTYKAEFHTIQPLLEVHWSLVLRPGYCGYPPTNGFVFYAGPGGTDVQGLARTEPSSDSTRVAQPAVGIRLLYTGTRSVGGQTWKATIRHHWMAAGQCAGLRAPD